MDYTNENIKNNQPARKISAGPIKATVWKNQGTNPSGEATEYMTISLERVYKDKKGEWQTTNSFRLNDLPKATVVLQKAYEELVLKEQPQPLEAF